MSLNNLSRVLKNEERPAEAEAVVRKAAQMNKKLFGNEHPHVVLSLRNLADVLKRQGQLVEADAVNHEALAFEKELSGAGSSDLSRLPVG